MRALKRFQVLPKTSKYYCPNTVTGLTHDYSSRRNFKVDSLTAIPDADKLWMEYSYMEVSRKMAVELVLNELITESNISRVAWSYSRKMQLLESRINKLVENNLVPGLSAVVDGLLSPLEPFSFDYNEIAQNEETLSVKRVRNIIQKQYLAWKFKTSVENINFIFARLGMSFSQCQSMKNLRRNVDIVESLPLMYQLNNIAEKIYHINQIPINISVLVNFQETLVGMNWHLFSQYCPKIMQHSYQYILFLLSILEGMQFTEKQIQEALPFLYIKFSTLLTRLNFILTHPEISKLRHEDKFLQLLSFDVSSLHYSFSLQKDCFLEVINVLQTGRSRIARNYIKSTLYCINQFYEVSSSYAEILRRFRNWRLVSEEQILDTLDFLKSNGFDEDEVKESITIIFYPRKLIESTLEKIKEEETALRRYGFCNGCVPESTNFFRAGTKSEKKRLQLCLYYLERLD